MRVLVLGAGVAGLSAAYSLARDGHEVTVLDQHSAVAQGASYANGAQLSYSYVAPLAAPGTLAKIPGWIAGHDSPMRFRPSWDPHQWSWILRFLSACTQSKSEQTTRQLLILSALSRSLIHELVADEEIEFNFSQHGKLIVYSDARAFRDAVRHCAYQKGLGCEQTTLGKEACVELEPALWHIRNRICGGVFTASDESGDCQLFCEELARILQSSRYGTRFLLGTKLRALRHESGRIVAAETDQGTITADAYILALGTASRKIALHLGFDLPILGLKGYSLTVPIDGSRAPRVSITDLAHKIVYARLGNTLRIAGLADFDRDEARVRPERLALLKRQARDSFPEGMDYNNSQHWVGSRPTTPTGLPILGYSPTMENLLLNVGHGALGFTLAMGSGRLIADRLRRKPVDSELKRLVN